MIEQYLNDAIGFTVASGPLAGRRLRVARTLLTCRVAAEILNEMQMPPETGEGYRFVNVCNPRNPLAFDGDGVGWHCRPALDEHPVFGLNWAAAGLVCAHLGARLPWAAEWEALASNNDPLRLYPWGDAPPSPVLANFDEHFGGTSVVGSFPPSELGLFDLAGNLGEWCQDLHDRDADQPMERVVKGGAWSKDAGHLRIRASRGKWGRLGTTTIGLRPVWDDQ